MIKNIIPKRLRACHTPLESRRTVSLGPWGSGRRPCRSAVGETSAAHDIDHLYTYHVYDINIHKLLYITYKITVNKIESMIAYSICSKDSTCFLRTIYS